MTTIAYRDGVMASDSRSSDEYGMHLTNTHKIMRLRSGALWGAAGDCDDRAIVDLLTDVKIEEDLPSRAALAETKVGSYGILVLSTGAVYLIGAAREIWEGDSEWSGWVVPSRISS